MIDIPILFPHPLVPRKDMTSAEAAFFREAMRRIAPYVGKAAMSIDDDRQSDGSYHYRLSARWKDPAKAVHRASGTGPTPGDALTQLIVELRPK